METKIMIRYGELSVKGKNKKKFIHLLAENIRQVLADLSDIKVSEYFDFMFVKVDKKDEEEVLRRLQHVFGIQSYSPAYELERDFEQLKQVAKEVVAERMVKDPIQTFKVATSRSDHHYEMDTNDINRELGAYLLEEFPNLKVQVKNPDLTVRVKVRFDDFVLSLDWIKAVSYTHLTLPTNREV